MPVLAAATPVEEMPSGILMEEPVMEEPAVDEHGEDDMADGEMGKSSDGMTFELSGPFARMPWTGDRDPVTLK